jgi:hypothetical protein
MSRNASSLVGLIFLAIVIAGCGTIAQGDSPAPEAVSKSQPNQVEAATVQERAATEAEENRVAAPKAKAVPTEPAGAITKAGQEDNAVIEADTPPDSSQVEEAEQPVTRLDSVPQPLNELADGEYGWSQLLPRDGILPIYDPEFALAGHAPYDDNELVIGVEINGEAKAYAIGPLNGREMVNDVVGGVPVLVTW